MSNYTEPSPDCNGSSAPQRQLEHIKAALQFFRREAGQVSELRILGIKGAAPAAGYFNDVDLMAKAAQQWSGGAAGVYFTPNPVAPELLNRAINRVEKWAKQTTADSDVLRLKVLLVDFDPERVSGISATAEEHQAALDLAEEVQRVLSSYGWPSPIRGDSGNGANLVYFINLANERENVQLLESVLKALDFQHSTDKVKVDVQTCNPSRLWRVYGTKNCKGDSSDERPHRHSRILEFPEQRVLVPHDLLEAYAQTYGPPTKKPVSQATTGRNEFDLERWIAESRLNVVKHGPWQGGERWILGTCPWNEEHTDRSAHIVRLSSGAIAAGCHHAHCAGNDWHALRDKVEPGWRDRHPAGSSEPAANGAAKRDIGPPVEIFTAADLLRMELPEAKCVVPGIVAEGLGLFAGKPKLGKSWLALHLALAIALGGTALSKLTVEAGDVLYLALEDTKRRLKKRLQKLCANHQDQIPERLHLAPVWKRQDKGGLADLADWLDQHPAARLIVIDTWAKFRPTRNRSGNDYEQDYQHASEVKALADKFEIGVLALHHCRKLPADDPLDEISGTLGLSGAADGLMVMRRERGKADASLFITGRDLEEQELAMRWEPQYALWSIMGDANAMRVSQERERVLEVLRTSGQPMAPGAVASILGRKPATIRSLMAAMWKSGQLKGHGKGRYGLPDVNTPTPDSAPDSVGAPEEQRQRANAPDDASAATTATAPDSVGPLAQPSESANAPDSPNPETPENGEKPAL
jgi:RecA-family ATPase